MNNASINRQPDGTINLTISLAAADIQKTREDVIKELAKTVKLDGFREGSAPLSLVEKNLNEEKVREEILKKLLPQAYSQVVQSNNLKPIMNPKIHIDKLESEKDWQFTATTCELPNIDLGNYKENIKNLNTKSKIIIPGQDAAQEPKKPGSQEIMKMISETIKAEIPSILIEQESDRLLSNLLNDIKKLGLNLDQYLASTSRSPEALRQEYEKRAKEDIALEFALLKIAEDENITVETKEIDEAIQKAKTTEEKINLENNRYMLAAILRQQKTLDFLLNL